MTQPDDVFAEAEPVAGLEHLGRAIVDMNGQISGSPANYEKTRGISYVEPTPEQQAAQVAEIAAQMNAMLGTELASSAVIA